jgi:hypothetical protein
VEEALEASATEGITIGMRLFDFRPFHVGFGIVGTPDEEATHFCRERQGSWLPDTVSSFSIGHALRRSASSRTAI